MLKMQIKKLLTCGHFLLNFQNEIPQTMIYMKLSITNNSCFANNFLGCGGQCQPATQAGSKNGINIFPCVVTPTWRPRRHMKTISTVGHASPLIFSIDYGLALIKDV